MNRSTITFLVTSIVLFYLTGCTPNKNTEQSESSVDQTEMKTDTVPDESAQEKKTRALLNANRASREELMSLPNLSPELVDLIINGRPYSGIGSLNDTLTAALSSERISKLYSKLFVPLNLNTASEEDMKLIPGVGDRMAHEFEEYRPYVNMAQFRREIGKYVGDEEVDRLSRYVFVPVNLNTATDEDILAIPGVGQRMLGEFKEYRPYQNMEQFRREIGKYVSDEEIALYERYLFIEE